MLSSITSGQSRPLKPSNVSGIFLRSFFGNRGGPASPHCKKSHVKSHRIHPTGFRHNKLFPPGKKGMEYPHFQYYIHLQGVRFPLLMLVFGSVSRLLEKNSHLHSIQQTSGEQLLTVDFTVDTVYTRGYQ